jgi:hypothetical protein
MDAVETKKALELLASRLATLSGMLDKAERESASLDDLAAARLAADMHPLDWQIGAVAYHARQFVEWSRGVELPNAVPAVTGWTEARAALDAVIGQVAAASAEWTAAPGERRITIPDIGIYLDFPARRYLDDWVLPNFYFHLVTAYGLLRMKGVVLGKADFLAHIGGDVRPIPAEADAAAPA